MDDAGRQARLRGLPSIDELLGLPVVASLVATHSHAVVVRAARVAVAEARAAIAQGLDVQFEVQAVVRAVEQQTTPNLRAVINATGVVLHTNLGRAPLSQRAIDRVANVARGYCNLELDLNEGERGSRYAPVVDALCALTGAEDALVVNNCAAAVLLTLSALAKGREAIVSRGELVEIGGGFRVPDVMAQSGATLVEVGTTNRTRLSDYELAVTVNTGALVKVHRANFAIVGFTEETTTKELAALAHARNVPLFEDLGSGALVGLNGDGLTSEPTVKSVVAAGADVVTFSADKLLGGPQAGIVVGRKALLAKLKAHPLNRALRIDKLTVAALEATLEAYRADVDATELPARLFLSRTPQTLEAMAKRLSALLGDVPHRVVPCEGQVGGGAMPLAKLPSFAVALTGRAEALHQGLRQAHTPVLGRIVDDALWLDVRCLREDELEAVAAAVRTLVEEREC